jgi:hypothetical protein
MSRVCFLKPGDRPFVVAHLSVDHRETIGVTLCRGGFKLVKVLISQIPLPCRREERREYFLTCNIKAVVAGLTCLFKRLLGMAAK